MRAAADVAFRRRLFLVLDLIGVAIRDRRWDLREGRIRRHAGGQHGLPRTRSNPCECDRYDRRLHALDSAVPACEPFEAASIPSHRLLHIYRMQHCGTPDTTGSSVISWVSARGAFSLDAALVPRVGIGRGSASDPVQYL